MSPLEYISLSAMVAYILIASVRALKESERAVIFRMGRFAGVKGPGMVFVAPLIDKAAVVDTAPVREAYEVARVTTADGHYVDATVSVSFRVADPAGAVMSGHDWKEAVKTFVIESAVKAAGAEPLRDLKAESRTQGRNAKLLELAREAALGIGVEVTAVYFAVRDSR